jgi:linoleoyl-CoA desaturase
MSATIKFSNKNKTDFHRVVTKRVDAYFAEKGISKNGDYRMVFKTAFMFALYFIPYGLIISGVLPLYAMWFCTVLMGLGLAGIGMSVMHDANHGAYSSKSWLNQVLGYSLNIVGGDAFNWKIQHNQLHHTYTNIHGFDQDIRPRVNLRLTPAVARNFFHRFQVVYAFALYSLQTFFWVIVKDFMQFDQYLQFHSEANDKKEKTVRLLNILLFKAIYYFYILVIPMLVLPIAWWQILLGFLTVHIVGGLVLTTVFQLAHVVEGTEYPEPVNGVIEAEWAIHQMQTTANFAPKNKLITFFVGGLNYQIEHHLFQRICHVHYPAIAPIVEQTAKEYGVPYLNNETFGSAVASHARMLNRLGWYETLKASSEF